MAKITAKSVREAVLKANQASKHMKLGVKAGEGGDVAFVWRGSGVAFQTMTGLSTREQYVAIKAFHVLALALKPEEVEDGI